VDKNDRLQRALDLLVLKALASRGRMHECAITLHIQQISQGNAAHGGTARSIPRGAACPSRMAQGGVGSLSRNLPLLTFDDNLHKRILNSSARLGLPPNVLVRNLVIRGLEIIESLYRG
jgi:hypothetical protein